MENVEPNVHFERPDATVMRQIEIFMNTPRFVSELHDLEEADPLEEEAKASPEGFSANLIIVANQMRRALQEVKNVLPLFSSAVSHMPEMNEDKQTMEHFCQLLQAVERIGRSLAVRPSNWRDQWNVYFSSISSINPSALPLARCCVCMEDGVPTVDVCNNESEPHLMCTECLLQHYWTSTEECTKSHARCPLCRKEVTLHSIVQRIADSL